MTRWMLAALIILTAAATAPARAQPNPSFNVANGARALITEVYASPAGVTAASGYLRNPDYGNASTAYSASDVRRKSW